MQDVSEMTMEEIETLYNTVDTIIKAKRHSYKDIMLMDILEGEIDRRGYQWMGIELIDKGE